MEARNNSSVAVVFIASGCAGWLILIFCIRAILKFENILWTIP